MTFSECQREENMELYQEILMHTLREQQIEVTFPNLKLDAKEIVDSVCYRALGMIKEVLADDTLDDAACFERIERIVCIMEHIGSHGGNRHDFV